ncbi:MULTISPECIES: tape measure protein [Olivibacter]|uniref:Tape measure protein n=1 Tax=Olivibacter jilunii TaxID=985016 RepID=A0ABW6AUY6_9SPHI
MPSLKYVLEVDDSALERAIRNAERRLHGLEGSTTQAANQSANAMTRLEKAIIGAFSVHTIQSFVSELVKVRGEFQQLDIAFTTMLKSKEKSDKLMAELIQFASQTPFGLKDSAKAAKQLLAYGSSAETVVDELRMLGDVAAGVSANIGDIVYLYGTLRTQGRAYAVDIRQFAGRGIPIYEELSKVLKINTEDVASFVEAGKVGFKEVEQAFRNMTAVGSMFGGLMEKQSASLTGQIEKLGDAWDVMLNKIGQSNEGTIGKSIELLADLVENYEKVVEVISLLIGAYGSYRAALLVTIALEKLAIANRAGVTASFALQYAQLALLQKAQAAYNAILAASPVAAYTAIIGALGLAIYSLTQTVTAAEEAHQALNKVQEESAKTVSSEIRSIENQISVLKSSTASAEQKASAYDRLNGMTKGAVKGYSQEEIAAGKAKTAIDEYIKSVQRAADARLAFAEFNRLGDEIDELERKGIDALSWSQKLGQSLKNTFAPTSQGLSAGEWWDGLFGSDSANKRIVDQVRNAKKTAQEEIKKQFADIWNEAVTGTPDDQPKTRYTRPRTVDVIEAEIKSLKEKQAAESTTQEQYKKFQKEIIALEKELQAITGKASKESKKELSDRKRFLLELAKIEDEVSRKSLTATEEKIQAERDRFAQLRREAQELGLGDGVEVRIDRAEAKATNDITYSENTGILTKQLERQKQMWEDYYTALDGISEEYAKRKYNIDLDYEKKLQDAIAPLMVRKLDGTITGVEEERLKKFVDLQEDFGRLQEQREQERYARAYDAAKTYGQRIEEIERQYQENITALGDSASKEQLNQLKRNRDEQISQETSAAIRLETSWEDTFMNMFRMGQKATRQWLKQARDRIEVAKLEGKITAQEYSRIVNEIEDKTHELNLQNPFKGIGDSLDNYRKKVKQFGKGSDESKLAFKDLADVASESFNIAAQSLSELGQGLQTLGIGSEGLHETLGKVTNLLGGIGELGKSIANGNVGGIVTGTIKTLTSVIDLFNTKDKRLQKQIEGYKVALKALEVQYDSLQRKIDQSVGKSYYDDSEAAIRNLQEQIRNLAAQRDAESKKKKKDKDAIEAYNDAIRNAEFAIEDIQRAISENLLQTNFKQLSDNLANALLSAFEAGENGIQALNKTFDQFIKNALANSLKLKLIEPLIKNMTDDLTEYMLDHNKSLSSYDFTGWREQLNKAGKDFNQALEEAYKGLGLKKEGNTSASSGLAGTIGRSITEDTANKWMGVQLNIYSINKNLLSEAQTQTKIMQSHMGFAQRNLDAALNIERNTAGTWDEMKNAVYELKAINKNTSSQPSLRGYTA